MEISFEREPARTPVSLRLPAELVREIERFAADRNIRKTDAYLHFLRLGFAAEQRGDALESQGSAKDDATPPCSPLPQPAPSLPHTVADEQRSRTALDALEKKLDCILSLLREQQGQMPERGKHTHAVKSGGRDEERASIFEAVSQASELFPSIVRAYLFGSVARDTFSDISDIDVRVELDPDRSFNLRDLIHYAKYIEQQTGREVDVVSARVIRNEALAQAIERERVLAYERKSN